MREGIVREIVKICRRQSHGQPGGEGREESPAGISEEACGIEYRHVERGIRELFEVAGIPNVVEYFRGLRAYSDLKGGASWACVLTKDEYEDAERNNAHQRAMQQEKREAFKKYRRVYSCTGHISRIFCLLLDKMETFLFTGGEDGLIKLWDLGTGRCVQEYVGHQVCIYDCSISHDNTLLVSSDLGGTVLVWDISTASKILQFNAEDQIDHVDFVYPARDAAPLELRKRGQHEKGKAKGRSKRPRASAAEERRYQIFLVTTHGKTMRIAFSASNHEWVSTEEVLMESIDDNSFRSSSTSYGGRMAVLAGLWPFALAFDLEDPEGKFMVLDTEDLYTSATATSAESLRFAVGTMGTSLFVWTFREDGVASKGNVRVRRKFKGRDLEGYWACVKIDVQGMADTMIDNLWFLSDDRYLVVLDSESNVRILLESEPDQYEVVKFIEKDFMINSIVPHPTGPFFLVIENNGTMKFVDKRGALLDVIKTDLYLVDGIFSRGHGEVLIVSDANGGMHYFSVSPFSAMYAGVPSQEFFVDDFLYYEGQMEKEMARESGAVAGAAGLEDTRTRLDLYRKIKSGIKQIRKKHPQCAGGRGSGRTFTLEGEINPARRKTRTPRRTSIWSGKGRDVESCALIQLSSAMITSKVFEKEYRTAPAEAVQPFLGSDAIEEDSVSLASEDTSSTDKGEAVASSEEYSDISMGEESTREEQSSSERAAGMRGRRGKRKASVLSLEAAEELAASKRYVSSWLMQTSHRQQPLLPQVGDRLIFIASRYREFLRAEREGPNALARRGGHRSPDSFGGYDEYEEIEVRDMKPHKGDPDYVELEVERGGKAETLLYYPIPGLEDPFVLHAYYIDALDSEVEAGETVYFYERGTIAKGHVEGVTRRPGQKRRKKVPYPTKTLRIRMGREVVAKEAFDLAYDHTQYAHCFPKAYSAYLRSLQKDENRVYFSAVRAADFPDYHEVVAYPATLSKILRRLSQNFYRQEAALFFDCRACLENCILYNEEDSSIVRNCKALFAGIFREFGCKPGPAPRRKRRRAVVDSDQDSG